MLFEKLGLKNYLKRQKYEIAPPNFGPIYARTQIVFYLCATF